MKFLNAESAARAAVRAGGATVMERWALGLRAAAGTGLAAGAAGAGTVSATGGRAVVWIPAVAAGRRRGFAAVPAAPEATLEGGALRAATFAVVAGAASAVLPVRLPDALVLVFSAAFAAGALLLGGRLVAAVFGEADALGFTDFAADVGLGDFAGDFPAGLAVALTPALAAALAVVPRLFPADAAMADLWLV